MALAVLRGNLEAALPLADLLLESHCNTDRKIEPIKNITCSLDKLRVLVFLDYDRWSDASTEDVNRLQAAVMEWLNGSPVLVAVGIDRIEVYQLP